MKVDATARTGVRLTPALCLIVLSLTFGALLAVVTPPLRGPDETAHFVRAYGLSRGAIVPVTVDVEGRKGVWMPAAMYRDFAYFERVRAGEKSDGFTYADAFADRGVRDPPSSTGRWASFVRYEGSEGYSPVAYAPQVLGAILARVFGLDFLGTLYAMRLAGLVGATAVLAVAVRLAGPLGWGFVAIAMLPSALYGRAVISADGMAIASAFMIAALFLRAGRGVDDPPAARGLWLLLCALSKPPNIVFALAEPLRPRTSWRISAAVIIPAAAATALWTGLSSADVAAWRLTDIYNLDAEQFEPTFKLMALVDDPMAFPRVLAGTIAATVPGDLWTQVVGIFGLFDTVLMPISYPLVTVTLVFACFARLGVDGEVRRRLVFGATAIVAVYLLALATIFYLVWTPIDSDIIWGVQGRYFVPALPFAAMALAGLVDRAPPPWLTAAFALSCALIGGVAGVEAVLRTDWGY